MCCSNPSSISRRTSSGTSKPLTRLRAGCGTSPSTLSGCGISMSGCDSGGDGGDGGVGAVSGVGVVRAVGGGGCGGGAGGGGGGGVGGGGGRGGRGGRGGQWYPRRCLLGFDEDPTQFPRRQREFEWPVFVRGWCRIVLGPVDDFYACDFNAGACEILAILRGFLPSPCGANGFENTVGARFKFER